MPQWLIVNSYFLLVIPQIDPFFTTEELTQSRQSRRASGFGGRATAMTGTAPLQTDPLFSLLHYVKIRSFSAASRLCVNNQLSCVLCISWSTQTAIRSFDPMANY